MELVYLWVEDYKNIQKEGFNFSPRFECEFNPIYENDENNIIKISEKSELIVKEKKNQIKSIFESNISITAIVGENGSGKSRILETFTKTDSNFLFYDENCNVLNLQDKFDVSLFNDNVNSYLYKNDSNVNQQILRKFTLNENATDELQFKINNLTISFLSQIGNINSDIHFSPTHIELIFSKIITLEEINTLNGVMIIYSDTRHDTIHRSTINISDLQKIKEMFEQKIIEAIEIRDIKSYLLLKEFIHRVKQKDSSIFRYFSSSREYGDDDNTESVFEYIYTKFLEEHSDVNFNKIVKILEDSNKEVFDSEKIILNYKDNDFNKVEILLVNIHRGYFNLQFFVQKKDDVLYFNDLSDGEQQLLLIFSKIYYLIRTTYKDSTKELIFLIDEPDTFLHPNWQRNFFANLYKFITNIEIFKHKKFHFIVTSHSPFILSDLPKENVIFLEKGKQVYPFEDGKQTFGANIHTLLSHGFFMKDGLMGEFAKNKINDVINFLNGNKSSITTNDEAQNLINIIGEPVIKKQLQKMLDSKRLSKIDEIDLIKNQMELLTKRLEEIENAKD
ncbi:MAG: AAA family ATPase [Aliarcobacter sp.]|jgi:predicted ATP-binding protein involved in virulence|nr:AAA family ATPase [Aliarcobacter sp.]